MKNIIRCLRNFLLLCIPIGLILVFAASIGYAEEIGVASYYSYECAKMPMANGKPFDPEKHTCASWFYKFGTVLEVKSLDTGKITEVVVTDRGPNKRLVREGRIIDLSKRAFQDICRLERGLTKVEVRVKK
jgi:rare lipoprotein A